MNLDFGVVERSLPYLWYGFRYTVQLTAIAALGGLFFGTLLAMARLASRKWLALPASGYVNLMRSIPLVLVIFWFFFLMPQMLQALTGSERPVQIGAERTAIITFIMFEAAYFCEIMRAGIQSIPKGQVHSAYALGLTYGQAMRLVILPQAFRNMIPVLLTQTIILFQDTSLVYVISATDFVGAASKVAQRDGRLVEMYLFVAIVYFVLCYTLSYLVKGLQKKIAVIR
ncbi:MAG: amino acid ABC transporter permease [Betaproteobacteria bacterium]|nr:MAG: amino acid ABC transporter permease [Betaproteobacteria bacterium]